MSSHTLPLRLRIAQVVEQADEKAMTAEEIYELIKDEYQGEGQFSLPKMEWHLMCIKAVGLIEGVEPYWNSEGEACYKYRITQAGRRNLAYLKK